MKHLIALLLKIIELNTHMRLRQEQTELPVSLHLLGLEGIELDLD
jgi:hypothetical protein